MTIDMMPRCHNLLRSQLRHQSINPSKVSLIHNAMQQYSSINDSEQNSVTTTMIVETETKNPYAPSQVLETTPTKPVVENSLAESVVYLMLLSIMQRAIGLARGLVVCMWLTPALLGPWDLANRFFFLAAPMLVLGLPGSFGRYLEYYRQRGAFWAVIRRTTVVCLGLSLLGFAVMQLWPEFYADLFFGHTQDVEYIRYSAVSLLAIIAYNYVTEMLTAVRLVKINAVFQFLNTLLFAGFSVGLLAFWRADAIAVIVAYGISCAVIVVAGIYYLLRHAQQWPADRIVLPHRELWAKLLPFAAWVWVTNFLTNAFESSGRYMILHYSQIDDKSLVDTLIGNYHAAQLVPNLIINMASMLGGTLLPYLSRDWEKGDRQAVNRTMNLSVKLFSVFAVLGSLVVMAASPILFQVVLKDKYQFAPEILHLTLACSCWAAIIMVSQMYLWCAERATIGCLSLLAGLVANVVLNYFWLPTHGLVGGAFCTAIAYLIALAVLYRTCMWCGLKQDPQTAIVSLAPGLLLLGFWPALIGIGTILALSMIQRDLILTQAERTLFWQALSGFGARFSQKK
jgi:polysaccharide transporter, PST family